VVSKLRAQRIADRIREELSSMLIYDVSDPRLSGVSITDVSVDRELAYASIYVSALEGSSRADEVINAFEHASGYLRSQLAKRIELRTFPRLRFNWDSTFERADRIEKLLSSLNEEQRQSDEIEPGEQDQDDAG